MSGLDLEVRNARAVIANVYAADARLQKAARTVVRQSGVRVHGRARDLCPVDTGFLRSQLTLRMSEAGLAYSVGWREDDFTAAGLAPYFYYVTLGTRTQAPQDCLTPAITEERPTFDAALSRELRAAIQRRGAA